MVRTLLRLETVGLIAVGGFAGASARYGIANLVSGVSGTFIANVIGCFLLGFLWYEAIYTGIISEKSQVVFGTGFLSSFTTYSTFAYETAVLSPAHAALYVGASYTFGFGAVLVGRAIATWIRETTHG